MVSIDTVTDPRAIAWSLQGQAPFFDVDYVRVDDPACEQAVEEAVSGVAEASSRHGTKVQLVLSFFQWREKKGFFSSREKVCWEQWAIQVAIRSRDEGPPTPSHRQQQQDLLRDRLSEIVRIVNSKRDHLPPISRETTPYEITLPSKNDSWGFPDMLKKLIQTPL